MDTCRCRLCNALIGGTDSAISRALHSLPGLTDRETQFLEQLPDCPDTDTLAARMNVSTRTVKFHLANLRMKLGGLSRLQLCLVATLAPAMAAPPQLSAADGTHATRSRVPATTGP